LEPNLRPPFTRNTATNCPSPRSLGLPSQVSPRACESFLRTPKFGGAPNQAGQFKFALHASDGTQITLDLKVNALWNLSLTPPQAAVGVPFSHAQNIGGGTPPYAFSASQLPPGLTISRDGRISGAPTKAGTYSASITVADNQGNTLNLPYKLYVNPIGVTTSDLPPAEPGTDYSQQLSATGGEPPYAWSLLDSFSCVDLGQRPFPGNFIPAFRAPISRSAGDLTTDGRLTVPTPLHYDQTFCVQVTDSAGNKARSALTVISLEPAQFPLVASFSSTVEEVTVGDPVSSTAVVSGGTSPYTTTALSLPPGFVFYPNQGIVFGYPQTPGVYTVRIQVTDGAAASVIRETTFRASPIRVGRASAGSPSYGKPYSQQFYAVNAASIYSWATVPGAQLPAGLTFGSAGLLSGTPLEAGYFYPAGRITDAVGNSRSFGIVLRVSAGTPDTLDITSNDTPVLTLGRESTYTLSLRFAGEAPYAWTVTGALPPGLVEQDDPRRALTFWGVPSASGSYPITVRVNDAKGNAGIRIIELGVTPLYSDSRKLPNIVAGVRAQIQLPVGGGRAPYRWSVAAGSSLPPGMTLSDSGVLSGSASGAGPFRFAAAVTDAASNTVNPEFTLQIDTIQILTPRALPAAPAGQPFSLQLEAISAAAGYIWNLQSPDCPLNGLTLSADGLLAGTPSRVGYLGCGVVATDAQGHRASSYFAFYVVGTDPPPFASIRGPITGNVGVGSFLSVPIVISAVQPYSIGLAPGSDLPPGLTLSAEALSGFPTKAGHYAFEIEVTDAVGAKASTRAYLVVSPVHIVSALPPGLYNQPYSYQLHTLERHQPGLWTAAPTDRLPAGLELAPDGLLSGIPGETGPFTFTVRAGDTAAKVTLTINSGSLYIYYARHEAPIPANVGMPFSHSLNATGGAFSLSSGELPPGLVLSSRGDISGTPAIEGVYTFVVRIDAGQGDFGIGVTTIRVGVMQGENRSLPAATVGKPYAAQLQGGTLAPGESLPPGLTLSPDGKLAGTPAAAWFFEFSVLINDSTGDSVTSTYTLEVLSGISTSSMPAAFGGRW
jgi:hypothetical protein